MPSVLNAPCVSLSTNYSQSERVKDCSASSFLVVLSLVSGSFFSHMCRSVLSKRLQIKLLQIFAVLSIFDCLLNVIISLNSRKLASPNTKLCFLNLVWFLTSVWVPFHKLQPGNSRNKLDKIGLTFLISLFIGSLITVLCWLSSSVWKPLFYIFHPVFCLLWWKDKSGPSYSIMAGN